jgi:hypothetical protein
VRAHCCRWQWQSKPKQLPFDSSVSLEHCPQKGLVLEHYRKSDGTLSVATFQPHSATVND